MGQGSQAQPGHGQGGHLGAGQQRDRSVSPKRRREDDEHGRGRPFQTVNRKPRKVIYGKSKITMDGAEAAPIEVFIDNITPIQRQHLIL